MLSSVVKLLITLCVLSQIISGNVIGIDFASDSMKIAIIQPGTPLEIVTNFQSKRKTPTCITFYRGERMFGSDSLALMGRKPELSFSKMYRMIGKSIENPLVDEISKKQHFPYELYVNETTNLLCLKQEETYYTPEELVAMLLQYAKLMTQNFGGKAVKDCVITVPSSFTQHEKEALFVAAEIADLNVLTLIEENTAAALNYGMDKPNVFDEPNVVLYYNMGAGSVQVSIVQYSSSLVKEGGKNRTVGQFEVVGKAWDNSLGGFHFDLVLADLLAQRFNVAWNKKAKATDKDLRQFVRPMTRLRLEANKIKEVLSANNEFPVKAEQLHADVDLNTKVTRAEFEEACSDLLSKITVPIEKALATANLTIEQVNAVELLGGGVRMPKVKKIIDEYFKVAKVDVGQHLNGDEAMALGAAFRAANLSTAFRVRKVGISDISTFGVSVRLETLVHSDEKKGKEHSGSSIFGNFLKGKMTTKEVPDDAAADNETAWSKYTLLYPAKSSLPSKTKIVAFPYDKDITCRIQYDDNEKAIEELLPPGTNPLLAVYNITGIVDFAKEAETKGVSPPKVHLSFGLDASGMVKLVKAEATYELPPEPEEEPEPVVSNVEANGNTTTNSTTIMDETVLASNSSSDAMNDTTIKSNTTTERGEEAVKDEKSKPKTTKKIKKPRINTVRRTLQVLINRAIISPPIWTQALISDSKARLKILNDIDDQRKAKEAALNDLEGFLLKVKNDITDKEDELKKVSTDEQRQEVIDKANAAEEWLYDEGRDQTVEVYQAKRKEISELSEKIFFRFAELTARADAIRNANKFIMEVRTAMNVWKDTLPHITESEMEVLEKYVVRAEKWIEEKVEAQEQVSPFESPVFESSQVAAILKNVFKEYDKLSKKPKPATIVPQNVTAANDTTSSNSSSNGSSNGTMEDAVKVELEDKPLPKDDKEL